MLLYSNINIITCIMTNNGYIHAHPRPHMKTRTRHEYTKEIWLVVPILRREWALCIMPER